MNFKYFVRSLPVVLLAGIGDCRAADISNPLFSEPTKYSLEGKNFPPALADVIQQIQSAAASGEKEKLREIAKLLSATSGNGASGDARGETDEQLFLAGYAYSKAGDSQGAADAFRRSLELRQNNAEARLLLALSLKEMNRCEEVFPELDQLKFLLSAEPPEGYVLRAECLIKLNRQAEAEPLLSSGRKAYPSHSGIKRSLLGLRATAVQSGALDDAQSAETEGDLAELAAQNPEDSRIQLLYAASLSRVGDLLTKSKELDDAARISRSELEKSGYQNEQAAKLLFDSLMKQRKHREAGELLQQLRIEKPDSEVVRICSKQFEIETAGLKVLKYQVR